MTGRKNIGRLAEALHVFQSMAGKDNKIIFCMYEILAEVEKSKCWLDKKAYKGSRDKKVPDISAHFDEFKEATFGRVLTELFGWPLETYRSIKASVGLLGRERFLKYGKRRCATFRKWLVVNKKWFTEVVEPELKRFFDHYGHFPYEDGMARWAESRWPEKIKEVRDKFPQPNGGMVFERLKKQVRDLIRENNDLRRENKVLVSQVKHQEAIIKRFQEALFSIRREAAVGKPEVSNGKPEVSNTSSRKVRKQKRVELN